MGVVAGGLALGANEAVAAPGARLLVGRGIADITGAAAENGMMGYPMPTQQTTGIHQRLRARAFVIADGERGHLPDPAPGGREERPDRGDLAVRRGVPAPRRRLTRATVGPTEGARVGARFEELDWRDTPMGEISLRRRREPTLDVDVYEVKLGDEYLMSSLFTVAEIALAHLGLAGGGGDVVVGGLGLGYTAQTVLADPAVRSLVVVEALDAVIGWHRDALLPDTAGIAADPRTTLQAGDFFAMSATGTGFDPAAPGRRFDAVLLDVDHSPRHVLHPSHAAFYTADGLRGLARHLRPGGIFALWSDDPPDADFTAVLDEVFSRSTAHTVAFANPLTGGTSANTVYVAS